MPASSQTAIPRNAFSPQSANASTRIAAALLAVLFAGTALVETTKLIHDTAPVPAPKRQPSGPSVGVIPPAVVSEQTHVAPVLHFLQVSPADAYLKNAAIPDSKTPDTPARPFYLATAAPADDGLSSHCLAQAVYYEAASESLDGQRAVAQVVLNRVRDRRFPKTVCGVVFEGSGLRTGCQFSFTCDGSLDRAPSPAAWLRAQAVAQAALGGEVMKAIGHATHYHTVWVTPYWGAGLTKWGRIGAHIFYRWAGGGAPVDIGLHPGGGDAPDLLAARATGSPSLMEAVKPAVLTAALAPAPSPPSAAPSTVASSPPAVWPPPLRPPVLAAPALASGASDAPYQAVRPRGGVDGPHFAARDHG